MRRFSALLLTLALALSLCGCGQQDSSAFRTLEVLGSRRYNLIYRLGDRIIPQVEDAMQRLGAAGELSAIAIRHLGWDAVKLGAPVATLPPATEPPEGAEPAGEGETPARRLILGVETEAAPMAYTRDGALQGMSVDIAAALGRALGCEVSYQPISPAEVGTQLASGNIDCALGFDPGTVRADRFTVGTQYLEGDVILAVRRDSDVKRLGDLKDQRVGTVDDPTVKTLLQGSDKLARTASGATVYLSPRRCLNALDKGWCSAVVMDRFILEHMA